MAIVNGYASLAEVKAELRIPSVDSPEDAAIETKIERASRAIDTWTGRRFYAATETRVYSARSLYCLSVPGMDLLSLSTLKTDEDGDRTYEVTWATTDYWLGPENAAVEGVPYWQIDADRDHGRWTFPTTVRRGVQIVGSFGYSTTAPTNVREACVRLAVEAYRARDRRAEVTDQPAGLPMLSMDIKALLWPYTRVQGVG